MVDTVVTETSRVHVFAIIVLLAAVAALVFFIIMSIYAYNLMKLKPPSKTESTAIFWASIIFAVIFLAIVIYALYKIFTHKSMVITKTPTPVVTTVPVQQTVVRPPSTLPLQTTQAPIRLNNTPVAPPQISDLSFTPQQKIAEDNLLIGLNNAFSQA